MRPPRAAPTDRSVWYRVGNRAAGYAGSKPLTKPGAQEHLLGLIQYYAPRFFCEVAAVNVLEDSFEMVVRFEKFRRLPRKELLRLAELFYADKKRKPYKYWREEDLERFNKRLFSISELMRNIDSLYPTWHNARFDRHGKFWAGRFCSTLCEDPQAVLESVLWVEMLAVEQGLAARPEQWRWSSARMRFLKRDGWLKPLSELFPEADDPFAHYRGELLARALNSQSPVSQATFERALESCEVAGGYYERLGPYLKRGCVLGLPHQVQPWLDHLAARRPYRCRGRPASVPGTGLTALRAPRIQFRRVRIREPG